MDFINKNNYLILFLLIILLGLLMIIKELLIRGLNKSNIEFEQNSIIGKKEIKEVCSEVVSSKDATLAVLADGLGKNEAGRISSEIAVKMFTKLFLNQGIIDKIDYFFRSTFIKTNSEILKRIESDQGGTAVASVMIKDGFLYYASVGDPVIAVFRGRELIKINDGHTVNVLAKKAFYEGNIDKEKALIGLKQRKLVYYLGQETFENIEIYETPIKLQSGDIVVLMNRGLHKGISWINLEKIINENRDLKLISKEMMEASKTSSKENSSSVVLIKYK